MSAQLHRALDWVEHEQPAYWQQQIKLAFDEVSETRVRLETCLMRSVAGRRPSCIEEKQNHRRARERLDYCQQMAPRVKGWSVKFRHAADEYRGSIGSLVHMVDVEVPRMAELIERTVTTLERYAEVSPGEFESATPTADKQEPPETA